MSTIMIRLLVKTATRGVEGGANGISERLVGQESVSHGVGSLQSAHPLYKASFRKIINEKYMISVQDWSVVELAPGAFYNAYVLDSSPIQMLRRRESLRRWTLHTKKDEHAREQSQTC